jgi:hypothetical protein
MAGLGSRREFSAKRRAEPFGKTPPREQEAATIDFKDAPHRIPR